MDRDAMLGMFNIEQMCSDRDEKSSESLLTHTSEKRYKSILGEEIEAMNKSELIEAVAKKNDISKSKAEYVVNSVFDAMVIAMERGECIELRGFGSFTIRKYKPYKGRNPKSGKAVSVTEKQLPYFRTGKGLKVLLNRDP